MEARRGGPHAQIVQSDRTRNRRYYRNLADVCSSGGRGPLFPHDRAGWRWRLPAVRRQRCRDDPAPRLSPATPLGIQADALGQTLSFWAFDYQLGTYYQTTATTDAPERSCRGLRRDRSDHPSARCWTTSSPSGRPRSTPTIARPSAMNPIPGIDGDARVTLLLLNIRDGQYHGGGNYVTGYFSADQRVPPERPGQPGSPPSARRATSARCCSWMPPTPLRLAPPPSMARSLTSSST